MLTLEQATEEGIQYMKSVLASLSNGTIPLTNMVGSLSVDERRAKIMKYKEKRMRKTWQKKISYDCRKRVADHRLRVKGRFVTKDQAYALLGMTP